jgi:hypothetical protein
MADPALRHLVAAVSQWLDWHRYDYHSTRYYLRKAGAAWEVWTADDTFLHISKRKRDCLIWLDDHAGARDRAVSGADAAPGRRRRRTLVSGGLVPEIAPRPTGDPNARVGTWRRGLTELELHRHIGSTQNYDDAT